jgi:methionyl aminopeptidase
MSIRTPDEIVIMREGGKRLARILNGLAEMVAPGVTPKDISAKAAADIKKADMQAVVLGYDGFPDVICISVNDNIVHGIPQKTPFKDGDVVKLDLTIAYKNLVVDSALTVVVGEPTADVKRLVEGTKKALEAAIAAVKGDGTRVGDISAAAENVMNKYKLGIIRDLVGHGIGYNIHEEPNIPNYGVAGTGPKLSVGQTIAIEPMAALGDWHIDVAKDGSTIRMADGSMGAHFEHTVLITDTGAEILTQE